MPTFVLLYIYFGMLPTSQNLTSKVFLMNKSNIAPLKQTMYSSVKNYLWILRHHFKVVRKNNQFSFSFLCTEDFPWVLKKIKFKQMFD